MSNGFHRYGVLLGFLVLGVATGCDRGPGTVTGPSSVSVSVTAGSGFDFQPATLRPEFLPGASCFAGPAFGTRIIVLVNGGVVVSSVRFGFTDQFGRNVLPRVAAIPGASPLSLPFSAIPMPSPLPLPGIAPLPTTSPIPVPGFSSASGLMVPAGSSRQLPFFLQFDCGVASEGTLFVSIDSADFGGRSQTSQLRVHVGF